MGSDCPAHPFQQRIATGEARTAARVALHRSSACLQPLGYSLAVRITAVLARRLPQGERHPRALAAHVGPACVPRGGGLSYAGSGRGRSL
jgi:hypothetical protein